MILTKNTMVRRGQSDLPALTGWPFQASGCSIYSALSKEGFHGAREVNLQEWWAACCEVGRMLRGGHIAA